MLTKLFGDLLPYVIYAAGSLCFLIGTLIVIAREINDLQVAVRKRDKRIAELEDKLAGMVEELRKLKDKTDEGRYTGG